MRATASACRPSRRARVASSATPTGCTATSRYHRAVPSGRVRYGADPTARGPAHRSGRRRAPSLAARTIVRLPRPARVQGGSTPNTGAVGPPPSATTPPSPDESNRHTRREAGPQSHGPGSPGSRVAEVARRRSLNRHDHLARVPTHPGSTAAQGGRRAKHRHRRSQGLGLRASDPPPPPGAHADPRHAGDAADPAARPRPDRPVHVDRRRRFPDPRHLGRGPGKRVTVVGTGFDRSEGGALVWADPLDAAAANEMTTTTMTTTTTSNEVGPVPGDEPRPVRREVRAPRRSSRASTSSWRSTRRAWSAGRSRSRSWRRSRRRHRRRRSQRPNRPPSRQPHRLRRQRPRRRPPHRRPRRPRSRPRPRLRRRSRPRRLRPRRHQPPPRRPRSRPPRRPRPRPRPPRRPRRRWPPRLRRRPQRRPEHPGARQRHPVSTAGIAGCR